ncbi:MAG TPA: hypothetical protein VFN56_00685 [Candidatus Saccharimonadales bacterium]|nr:hypothetical protein [Candidatus Saccharimonadales bacterium]
MSEQNKNQSTYEQANQLAAEQNTFYTQHDNGSHELGIVKVDDGGARIAYSLERKGESEHPIAANVRALPNGSSVATVARFNNNGEIGTQREFTGPIAERVGKAVIDRISKLDNPS